MRKSRQRPLTDGERNACDHDASVPMRVLVLDHRGGTLARCAGADGIPATIETALVRPVEPGAILLVQSGVALLRLDEELAL